MASPTLDPIMLAEIKMAWLGKAAWNALAEIKIQEKHDGKARKARTQVAGVSKRVQSKPVKPDMLQMLADEAIAMSMSVHADSCTTSVDHIAPSSSSDSDTFTCLEMSTDSMDSMDLQSCVVSSKNTFDDLVITPELDACINAILADSFVEMFGSY